jgi:hypothetical protein
MPETPTQIPAQLTAGDTATWKRSYGDYPASAGWSLVYYLVNSAGQITFTSTADGDDHLILVPAATTTGWTSGGYQYQERAEKAGEKYTLATGRIEILPNLAAATTGLDARTHARKVLDVLEAWLESRANWAANFSIAGRSVQHIPIPELLTLRDTYRAEVRREESAARAAQGLPSGNRVLVRFA